MAKLGLGNIPREQPLKTVPAESNPTGYATKLEEVSLGKDTMTGHWEIRDLILQNLLILSGMDSQRKFLLK